MVINTNVEAQRTAANLATSYAALSKSLSRLSSGSKIVNPADDAAGLAVSSRMQSVKQRLEAAMTNISSAVSITQTQDGYMKSLNKAMIRMSELSLLAQDASKTDTDRALYDKEFQQLKDYVESTSGKGFNGVPLFGGQSMNIIIDADGSGFNIPGINMKDDVYANAISDQLWELDQQVWKTSKDGFKLETDAWKLSQDTWKLGVDAWKLNQDMWYNNNTDTWSDTDPIDGSVKYDRDYYIHIDGVNILSAPPLVASEDIPPLVASKDIEDGFSVRGSTLSTEDMDFDTARTGINLDANKDISGFKVTQAAPPEQSGIQMGGERHSGIAVDQATSVWTLSGDIFDDNDIVKFEDGFPTATPPLDTNTLYYTKKIDASTFELYYDSGLTQKIDIQSTGESGSYTLTEFSMDLEKTDHGYVTGDMVTFSQGTPENIDEGDTYYVRKSDDDTFTLHTTLTDAQSGNNPLLFDYTDSQFTLEKLSNTVVTLAKHGFQDEEQVTFRDSAPGGATVGTPYFVKKIDDNTFTLHATQENAENNVDPITLAATSGTSTSWSGVNLDSSVLEGIAADATTNIWTKASHGLEQGDTIQIKEGDLTQLSGISGDVAYVKVIDENTFTLHSTPSGAQPLPSGLVAHYPLDGNANDASGNGLNGTVVGGAGSGTDRTGTANSAYDLDGVDDYINIGNDPQLALDKYTVGAWFKHDSDHPSEIYRTLIAKGEGVYAHQMNYQLLVGNDTGQLVGRIGHGGNLGDPGPTTLDSGVPVDDGQWHHAAVSFDSDTGEAALYLDGALVDSKSGQLPAHTNAGTDANIGIWRDPVYGEWDGGVDDVQIYDRALSAAEIKQVHQIGVLNDNPIDVLQTGTYSLAEDPQVLKLDGHNFKAGDQVKFTSNAPAGAEVGKAYYVGGINGDNFALYNNLDDAVNSNTSNGTEILLDPAAAQFTLEQLNREFLMQGTERAELLKLANHGYQSGEKIHFDGAVPDTMPPVTSNPDGAGAWYYVHKVDQDNFTLHSSEADALSGTGSIKFNNSTTTFDLEGDRYTDYVRMSPDKPGHGYVTGDRVMVDPSVPAGTTPTLNAGTPYFIGAQDERTYSIHTTLEDAQNGINAVQWDLAVIDVENIGAIEYLITKDTANITREAHGYNTGAAVMFSSSAPGGADNTTAYYVNSADADNFTLHNSLEDAQNGVNAINLNHTETESYSLLPAVLITKEAHGYNTGATVLLSGTTPGGADSTTMYYVNSTDADNFTLHNSLEDAQNGVNAVSLNQTSYSLLSTTLPSTAYSSGDYVFDNVVTNGTLAYTDARTHLAGTFTTTDLISDGLSSDKAKTFTSGAFIATDPVGLGDISESQRVAISAGTFVTVNPIDSGEDANAKVYESGTKISSSEDLAGFGTNLGSVRLTDIENAKSALALISASVERITMDRASLGAILSRMQYTSDRITEHKMNLSAAISRISDVDVAEEATNYARQQILVQSGTQMLGQANDLPRTILELLRR